jgi:hypothetical protein
MELNIENTNEISFSSICGITKAIPCETHADNSNKGELFSVSLLIIN